MFVVKVPGFNGLGKNKGCEKSGNEILKVLKDEIFSNESGKEINFSNLNLEEIHLDNSNLELTNKLIYKNAFNCFQEKEKTIFLGGDHSISYSLTRAFFDYSQNSGKEPCLIVFDAHPDLMKVPNGSEKFPSHEEWLRKLIEDGFPVENILLVGLRNSYKEELDFIREKKIKTISMNQLVLDLENSCDIVMEFSKAKDLYVSLDIDVVDPAFAPAVNSSEPGGLSSREIIYLFQRINKIKNLRGVDIVEINSEQDKNFNGMTVKLGAKILSGLV